MPALLTDEQVGIGLQSDAEVGLASDADVGLAPPPPQFGDALSHTHQAINAAKRLTGFGDQPRDDVDVPTVASVMKAFGHEAKDAFGPDKLGLSDASAKILADYGWFRKEGRDGYNPFGAFNELLFGTVAGAGDFLLRGGTSLFRGSQAAVFEATGNRDLAALPEAFFGSPHPLGIPKKYPAIKARAEPVVEAARGGEPSFTAEVRGIEAYHGSPHDFEAFNLGKIGTGEGAQSYGHGLYFAEHPEVAKSYSDMVPRAIPEGWQAEQTSSGSGQFENRWRVTDPDGKMHNTSGMRSADDAIRNVMFTKDMAPPGNIYKVRINADPAHFLDWDKPLSEQSPEVQAALGRLGVKGGNNPGSVILDHLAHNEFPFSDVTGGPDYAAVSAAMRDAGIPGIKYLDQGSRDAGAGTRNFVLFDDKLVEVTHKNGVAVPDLPLARDLGVIGPERPPITEGAPEQAARRTVAAERVGDEKITGEVEPSNPWQERFEQFVSKLEAPEDVKQLIRDAAKDNNDFMPARQGDVPLHQLEDVAAAAGFDPSEVNMGKFSAALNNPARVRVAMQMMLQVTKNVTDAARDVRASDTPEALIKLQEAIMRRDMAVENVVGLRAEWGKTGNVFQEFLRDVKDAEGLTNFLRDKGRGTDGLRHIADALDELDGAQTARFLNDLRTPNAWDKFMYYWVNALISGPVTHTKYIIANAAFAGYESAVVTPIAGAIGAARRAVTGTHEGVYIGEAGARLWGIVAGVPDALVASVRAARTGLQTALPGEVAQGIVPKMQRTIAFQQKPIEGPLGTAIGIPSRGASAIHSFFNFLGYRASMEAQAYRLAAKEGLKPTDDAFWQRRASLADAPNVEMMNEGIEEGYRLTFINELSPGMKKVVAAVRATKIGQLALPFLHIPFNILARGIEGNPALAALSAETRAAVTGKSGAVKQDMAMARLVAGSALGVWAVNLVANDRMTGFGPTEPKERDQWLATGHQPYSIRIGDYWYSFNRFGPLGTMLGIHANLAEAIPHMKPDHDELTKALTMTVHATGRLLEDEVGMQGLAGLIEAINEPERKGTRFVSNFAGSLMPYSSLLRQTASAMDTEMREVKTVVDGLRYYIPAVRQGLLPKRDWTGNPIANAGYGGDLSVPGASAVIQHRQVGADPIAFEMKALDLNPARPSDRIGGVKLPPALYDRYQSIAGPMTRHALEQAVDMPGWYDLPVFVRQEVFRGAIRSSRDAAGSLMQISNPQIINQAIENRVNRIEGNKPTKLKE